MKNKMTLSGLRIEHRDDGLAYFLADIDFEGFDAPYEEREMWFAVKESDAWMFETESYDAFFLVPLYLAMYHKAMLCIEGTVSRTLYRNMMDYGQQILCNFSPALEHVAVEIGGYEELDFGDDRLIGTGISCGVDSLSTIYDRLVKEKDPNYRLTSLFLFNCGTHGDFEDEKSRRIFEARFSRNSQAASDLGLPIYFVNSNLHAFTHKIGEQKLGYFAIYSCVLSIQRAVKRYYVSSSYSYDELLEFKDQSHDFDMAEYCESYLVPLVQTESFTLVLDGAQYKRSEKIESIAGWEITKQHLNVCVDPGDDERNCSSCPKCMRTLIILDALDMLDDYADVFDVPKYKALAPEYKSSIVYRYGKEGFTTDNVDFARERGLELPSKPAAFFYKLVQKLKRVVGHVS